MSWGEVENAPDVTEVFRKAATRDVTPTKASPRREISPFTLRLTRAERERLEELATGMTLSAYGRVCVFAKDAKRRKAHQADALANKRAAAESLALLGQSRMASNLNQLAHHANLGILIESAETKAQIAEANAYLLAIRTALMTALGKRV
ncbi:MAG: plasmid mobilization relaxosome protein MobC [Thalassovita sp.]